MARIRPARSERRPWPAPAGSWFMQMRWLELCFLHWRVDAEALAPLIPRGLTLDTFDGSAWIGVVPFRMTGVAARAMPRVRQLSDFAELNVRTYVTAGQKPGVWFFSLDATQPLAVRIARKVFHLPYVDARIALTRSGDSITYRSVRTEPGRGEAELGVRYAPTGPAQPGEPGTLEHFLTERYCLYAANAGGRSVPHRGGPPAVAAPAGRRRDRDEHDDRAAGSRPSRRPAAGALRRAARGGGVAAYAGDAAGI